MTTIAEFTVPTRDFPLGHLFETLPDVTIEIECVVPTSGAVLPYFWVRNVAVERVRGALEAEGALESFTVVDDLGSQGLIRADWSADVEGVLAAITDAELTLLSATGTEEEWRFEFRTEDTDQIVAFQQYCTDLDIGVELVRLYDVGETGSTGQYNLTPDQREALLLAYDNGYYEIPRRDDLGTLAEELGIARQSFADRLRRGHRNLIGETVARE